MKLHLKHSLNLCLVVSALLLTSCGKKENKVSSNGVSGSSPFYTGNSSLNSAAGSTIVNQVQSIKSSVACLNGYRLTNDVSFYVQGGIIGSNRIGGNWISGFSPNGGTVNKMWIGVSAYRDLMFVTQVMNGSSVMGFNVTLSFCEMKNASASLPSVISNERALTNFVTPNGIVVSSTATCGYNVVSLSQQTYITSQRDLNNPYSPIAVQVPTSFAPPSCN
jgi:hypothetical protein